MSIMLIVYFYSHLTDQVCGVKSSRISYASSMTELEIYYRSKEIYEQTGDKIVVDADFLLSNPYYIVVGSLLLSALLEHREATAIQQLNELGLRMMQGQFLKIRDQT